MKQTISPYIDYDAIKKSRVLAASRNKWISKIWEDEDARIVEEADIYDQAPRKAFLFLKNESHGGGSAADREMLHADESLR